MLPPDWFIGSPLSLLFCFVAVDDDKQRPESIPPVSTATATTNRRKANYVETNNNCYRFLLHFPLCLFALDWSWFFFRSIGHLSSLFLLLPSFLVILRYNNILPDIYEYGGITGSHKHYTTATKFPRKSKRPMVPSCYPPVQKRQTSLMAQQTSFPPRKLYFLLHRMCIIMCFVCLDITPIF